MVKIRDQLVTASVARTRTSPGTNPRRYITVHETANRSRGANAAAHANLQSRGNARVASWHYQVDDREIVRSYRDTVRCWHAGDGGGHGNMSSIAIEICVNADGDYERALANAADLVRYLRAKHSIPRERVVQHNRWSGKNCPTILRSRGTAAWRSFVASTDPMGVKPTTPISNPVRPAPATPSPGRDWFDMATKQDLRDVIDEAMTVELTDAQMSALATGRRVWAVTDLLGVLAHRAGISFQRTEHLPVLREDSIKIKTALQETQENSRLLPRMADKVEKTNHAAGRLEQHFGTSPEGN